MRQGGRRCWNRNRNSWQMRSSRKNSKGWIERLMRQLRRESIQKMPLLRMSKISMSTLRRSKRIRNSKIRPTGQLFRGGELRIQCLMRRKLDLKKYRLTMNLWSSQTPCNTSTRSMTLHGGISLITRTSIDFSHLDSALSWLSLFTGPAMSTIKEEISEHTLPCLLTSLKKK